MKAKHSQCACQQQDFSYNNIFKQCFNNPTRNSLNFRPFNLDLKNSFNEKTAVENNTKKSKQTLLLNSDF